MPEANAGSDSRLPAAHVPGANSAFATTTHWRYPGDRHSTVRLFAPIRLVALASALAIASFLFTAIDANTIAAETPTPPASLDVQITSSRDSVERGQPLTLFFVVTNRTSTDVRNLTATLDSDDFSLVAPPTFLSPLTGFSSVQARANVVPNETAPFGSARVLVTLAYTWTLGGQEIHSAQGSVVTVQVTRRFEEESKGFLGGNGAFLYLVLPVVPLFLGYQIVDHRRRQGTFALPSLKADYVVVAFLMAVVLNLILLIVFKRFQLDYSDPATALAHLVGSFVVGAGVSGVLWGGTYLWYRPWTYRESDSAAQYLRKVLLRPDRVKTYERVTGTSDGETWQGILLHQPTGAAVLGATLQASPAARAPKWETLTQEVLDPNGTIIDETRLAALVEDRGLTVTYLRTVTQGGVPRDTPVVTGLKSFTPTAREAQPLVVLTR